MARIPAGLPAGIRVSDHISLGVIAEAFPPGEVRRVLAETGRASERERDLPAHVTVYYAIALALYTASGTREVLRCLLEGLRWLWGAEAVRVAGKSGISQARTRLGEAPLRRLYERLVRPVATPATKGAWYRERRPVSLDGSCLDVADTAENEAAFGRPGAGRGGSAFPQLRFVALAENGTHVLFGARPGGFAEGETTLAHDVLPALGPGMLCLADRQFFGHALWGEAAATGADLLWRVKRNLRLPRETVLADGSFLSTIYPSGKDRRHKAAGVRVRVVECRLEAWRRRAALPAGHHPARPGRRSRDGAGRALPRAVGDRGRARRAEDAAAGARSCCAAGPPGWCGRRSGAAAGALRGARADARGGAAGRRGPGRLSFCTPTVVRRKLPLFAALPPRAWPPGRGGAGRDPGGAGREQPRPEGAARGRAEDERLPAAAPRPAADHLHQLLASRRRPLANEVAFRDPGPVAHAGRERPLAQMSGAGAGHRSFPVGPIPPRPPNTPPIPWTRIAIRAQSRWLPAP